MKIRRFLLLVLVICASACALAGQEQKSAPAAGYQIRGVVVNALDQRPLGRANVTITHVTGESFARTLLTGDDGRFAFSRLPEGKYALTAERRGFRSQPYEQHEDGFSSAIVLGPDRDATALLFRIWPDASLTGTVSDDDSEPARNARVVLIRELLVDGRMSTRVEGNASTDDQGRYHFAHLKAGAYYIAVAARPWYAQPAYMTRMRSSGGSGGGEGPGLAALDVAYPLTFYPDVTDWTAATPIRLRAGDRATADIALHAVPALHLRIRNSSADQQERQAPRETLAVPVFDGIDITLQTAHSRMERNISLISGFAPGHYLLRVDSNAPKFPRPQTTDSEEPLQPVHVRELDLFGDVELDATEIPPAAVVSGSVHLANGQPPSKLQVITLQRGATQRPIRARTDSKGTFTFPGGLAPGTYEVLMSNSDDLFIRRISAAGTAVAGRTLRISGPDPVKLNILVSQGAGTVQGVALRDGKPVAGAMILLVPQDAEENRPLFRRDQSDSDGSFTLSKVLPGRYTLLALEHGWDLPWAQPAVLKPYLIAGDALVVEAKGSYNVRVEVQQPLPATAQ